MQPSKIYINNPQIVTVTCATITGYINFQCIKATYKHSVTVIPYQYDLVGNKYPDCQDCRILYKIMPKMLYRDTQ